MKKFAVLLLPFLLTACANSYNKYYVEVPGATPENIARFRAAPPLTTPLVEHSPTVPSQEQYENLGYGPIGHSSFTSGRSQSENHAIAQGRKVGADLVVIVNPSYAGSVTSQVPITTPTSSTSYTTGSATAYGSGGSATAYGNSTTTTYGNKTTYIPMTVNRYNYGAVYFIKRTFILGANWRDLTNDERAKLQSNSGLFVTSVVNDSPAFRNDVLVGDIIVKIDGQQIYGQQSASDALASKRGKEIVVTIFRNEQLIEKAIKLAN